MLATLSIRHRLLLGFSILTLNLLVIGLLQYNGITKIITETDAEARISPHLDAVLQARYSIARMMQLCMEVMEVDDTAEGNAFAAEIQTYSGNAESSLQALDRGAKTALSQALPTEEPKARQELEIVLADFDGFTQAVQELVREKLALLAAGKTASDTLAAMDESMDAKGEALMARLEGLRVIFSGQLQRARASMRETSSAAKANGFFFIAVGVVLAVALSLYTTRSILRPLANLRAYAGKVTGGDLKATPQNCGRAELGALCADMQGMVGMLKEKLALSQGVLEGITNPAILCNVEEKILFVNVPTLKLLSKPGVPKEYLGMHISQFFYGDITRQSLMGQAIKNKEPIINREVQVTNKDGSKTHVRVDASPVFDEDGEILAGFIIYTDLTKIYKQQEHIEERRKVLAEQAGRSQEVINRLAAAATELAAQVEQGSRGAEEQAALTAEASTAMEEMNATIAEVARSTADALRLAEEAEGMADQGAGVMREAVDLVETLNAMAKELDRDMRAMGERAEAITQVTGVISDIADQTNLLALNAAIEAARAGDAGRGFAVVADEVRKLAEKTMTATREVNQTIGAIQTSARQNIQATEKTQAVVQESTEKINQSGSMLTKILGSAQATNTQLQSIATAAEEQSATGDEISRAMGRINGISQDTSDGMAQSANAVNEVAGMSEQLREIIEAMNRAE